MLDDLPQGRKSHASPIRTHPRDSSVGAERFKALLAAAQICKQTENQCIIVRYIARLHWPRSICADCAKGITIATYIHNSGMKVMLTEFAFAPLPPYQESDLQQIIHQQPDCLQTNQLVTTVALQYRYSLWLEWPHLIFIKCWGLNLLFTIFWCAFRISFGFTLSILCKS